jgi:hypothetical protein
MTAGEAIGLAAVAALVPAALATADPAAPARWPVVGAIRWDAWRPGSEWERNLGPRQWRSRLPFYGREVGPDVVEIRGDTQAVMDQEIAYAAAAGLDYWAYCFYLPTDLSVEPDSYAVRLHLASAHKTDVGLCFILMGQGWWGPKAEYAKAAEALARYMADPAYQKAGDGRPLLYVFYVEQMIEYFGGEEGTRQGLDLIRRKAEEAGAKAPWIVAQVWSAESGRKYVEAAGFDAISAYTWADFSQGEGEHPYSSLAAANRALWEAWKGSGEQVVPLVNAGNDNRPRRRDPARYQELYKAPPGGPWYTPPTPDELGANVGGALDWVAANPGCTRPRAVLIYAWNESDEGGWLVPTAAEGTARLDAMAKVLKRRAAR